MAPTRRTVLLAATSLLAAGRAAVAGESIRRRARVFLPGDGDAQRRIAQVLRQRAPQLPVLTGLPSADPAPADTVTAAIGPVALRALLAVRGEGAVVSAFTSRQTYKRLLAEAGPPGGPVTAIYAEPSPAQQMQLIAAIFGRRVAVGVFLSEQTAGLAAELTEAARAHGLELDLQRLAPAADLSRALNRLRSARVLLIVPDAGLYTPRTLRELIESGYRRRLPIVGFSAGLVAAGTLATAYADIDDTVAHLVEVLQASASGPLPPPGYPRYWRVAVNDHVARSLDIVIDESVRRLGEPVR